MTSCADSPGLGSFRLDDHQSNNPTWPLSPPIANVYSVLMSCVWFNYINEQHPQVTQHENYIVFSVSENQHHFYNIPA